MDRSPYLQQALQMMQGAPAQPQQWGMSVADLGAMAKEKRAWQAANPGQSYLGHNVSQMGQNIRGLPGRIAAIPGQVTQIPGQIGGGLKGLFSLGGR